MKKQAPQTVRIVVAGAAGRMGQALVRCARSVPDIHLVGAVEAGGHKDMGKDSGLLAGAEKNGVALSDNLEDALGSADVLVDFTFHTAVPGNVVVAADLRRATVIGTTGLDAAQAGVVTKASETIPIVWAPNMSLGVNILFAMVKKAGSILGPGYMVEIDETHHVHKKDAPSGTALRLGENVAEGLGWDFKTAKFHAPEGAWQKPMPGKIVIRSHREGETVGDHTVSFGNEGERIEFTHRAWSREAFAMGALHAAKWVVTRKPALYDMQDVLGLK